MIKVIRQVICTTCHWSKDLKEGEDAPTNCPHCKAAKNYPKIYTFVRDEYNKDLYW